MNKRYKLIEVRDERWAIWYLNFPKRRGGKIGCYKIIDLFKATREKNLLLDIYLEKDKLKNKVMH